MYIGAIWHTRSIVAIDNAGLMLLAKYISKYRLLCILLKFVQKKL